ncbi:MAG: leucyl aminopeptidase family protein [Solirubrobacteraceae bacterium]
MEVSATSDAPFDSGADTIAVGVFEGEGVSVDVADGSLRGLLDSGEARRSLGKLALTHAGERRLILVGLGHREVFDAERARLAAAAAWARAGELSTQTLCWQLPAAGQAEPGEPGEAAKTIAVGLVEGTLLRAYRFDRYRATKSAHDPARLLISAGRDLSAVVARAAVIARAQNRARDLANTPANDLTPERLAEYARAIDGLAVTILDEEAIRAAGMGAFAAVAQGSAQPAQLIRLSYDATGGDGPLTALIGKAVTFDSGGLSLKPSARMSEMKFDMAGGAAVIEAMAALAELGAPVRVLGVVGATENMPSGRAIKPGDIVTSLDGTTIEVNNTDAEGRLVLADCLTYAIREGAERLVDIATLTGGIVVALGSAYAGLMCNDDELAGHVQASAVRTGELVWRMPLHERYAELVKGRYGQLTNLTERREASSITAAELLHHFAREHPWAHLDIAGTAYDVRRPYFTGKGATGFGVRLMVDLVESLAG